jgi:hypothetical protein
MIGRQARWTVLFTATQFAAAQFASDVADGHPGVGIVEDSRGNIYYTDLKQVWKIAPDGQKSVAVAGVHTHELCLDADDKLYGEHLWYEGDATKKWGHRVWRLAKDGTLSDVLAAREGFLNDYSFVRDRVGNMYWVDVEDRHLIKKRTPDGKIAEHARFDFRDPRWMTVKADDTLLLIDGGDLLQVSTDGQVKTIAKKLSGQQPPPAAASERHYQMGLWTDVAGSVYVAVSREHLVLKVEADGKRSVAARSPSGWSPSGGMFARDGSLWLLEYDGSNAVRARRVGGAGEGSR